MQNFEKQKKKNWSGDTLKRYLAAKFGINLLDRFWENGFHGRTTDARLTTVGLLYSSTKQS